MSYYESFLSWWYSESNQASSKVVIVGESDLQAAIHNLNPVAERQQPDFHEPELFVEMKERCAELRYKRNLRAFEDSVCMTPVE